MSTYAYWENADGTWTAQVGLYPAKFTGTYCQALNWLRSHGRNG